MLRILFINALMFSLPFLIYGAYFYATRKGKAQDKFWSEVPLLWLLGASAALVFGAMITLVSFGGSEPSGNYVPPRLEDGVIAPGQFE